MKSEAEYRASRGIGCVNCHAHTLQVGNMMLTVAEVRFKVRCKSCGAEWVDKYELKGYIDFVSPTEH